MNKKLLIVIIFLLANAVSEAQINAFAGYVYAKTDVALLNTIIDKYNIENTTLTQTMPHFTNLQGMELGLRYRFPNLSLEFGWSNKFSQAKDQSFINNKEVKNFISYKNSTFILGGELYYGWVGIGVSFDFNRTVIKRGIAPATGNELMNESNITNHYFVNIDFPINNAMSLSLRPFLQLPITQLNFYEVAKSLNSGVTDAEAYRVKVVNFGFKIILFNGTKAYSAN